MSLIRGGCNLLKNVQNMVAVGAFVLTVFFVSLSAFAMEVGPGPGPGGDIEILPGLAAEYAGTYVEEDVSFDQSETSVVIGDGLTEATPEWLVHFLEPFDEDVPASRAMFVLGKVEGEEFVMVEPYTMVHAAVPGDDGDEETVESALVSFPELILKDPATPSGLYTLRVYTYPDTKTVENTDPLCYDWDYWDSIDYEGYDETCFPEEPYTEQDFLNWFEWNVLINEDEYEGEIPETYDPEEFRQLTFDYTAATGPVYQECCSSVVFLPGFEGSVLKLDGNQLWPPTFGEVPEDIGQLFLLSDGEPEYSGITADEVIENFALGPFSSKIYADFVSYMDSISLDSGAQISLIQSWEAFPYDWRLPIDRVISDEDMIARLESIAVNSDTGQVTIVAHSMGGLIGKEIVRKLEAQGKEDLVDSFVMVGTPQLGTPQAMTGLLHGEGANIPVILNKEAARSLAYNMQSAHNLLPSEEYFNRVTDPVVTFDSDTSFTQIWRDFWGLALGNFGEYFDFIVGNGPSRTRPAPNDTQNPEMLRTDLVQNALSLHNELDTYEFPANVNVVQIAGWGFQTIKGIEYTEDGGDLDYEPDYTVEGDSTVVYPSAISYTDDDGYYAHLINYNRSTRSNAQHRNLVGAEPVLEILEATIKEELVAGIDFVSKTKPVVTSSEDALLVSAHSPVSIGVYDELGNFTGIAPGQNQTADMLFVQENIPGSSYRHFGEGKYIVLPKQGIYTFVLQGTGTGNTTLVIETLEQDVATTTATYSAISTTPQTLASFTVNSAAPDETEIELDTDGDGNTDKVISPDGAELTLEELFDLLKEKINQLNIKKRAKIVLIRRVEILEQWLPRAHHPWLAKIVFRFWENVVENVREERLGDVDRQELLDILEQIKERL